MPDGTRLAARIWLPVDATADPVPGILELLPYRKNDGTALRDARNAPYFAGHGYVFLTVDVRGRGNSEGEFTPLVIAQIADALPEDQMKRIGKVRRLRKAIV